MGFCLGLSSKFELRVILKAIKAFFDIGCKALVSSSGLRVSMISELFKSHIFFWDK